MGRSPRTDGFTLLETLVALAVLSLAALALLRLVGFSASASGDLDRRFAAGLVARNVAIDTLTDPKLPGEGIASGRTTNANRQWSWTRRIARAADPSLQSVTVTVADDSGPAGALTLYRRTP